MPMGDSPHDRGAGRRYLTRAVEASLRRLGTDWVDLYQVHWPDPSVPLEETLRTLDDLVSAGKIRFFGLSNYTAADLQHGIDLCDVRGWSPIASHQPQYSLVSREIELDSLPLCARNDIAVLPWSPLGGGVLTGKYADTSTRPADTRMALFKWQAEQRLTEQSLRIAGEVGRIAAELGRSSAQVALNWVLHRPGVTAPILGARNVTQLEDNLGAEGWALSDEHVAALDKISERPLPYPYDMYRMLFS
jgi:aryl-alcohol dehydrogenase-like predicted oxidoreductase